jgi:methylase of polypeptide subunit release factors
MTTLPEPRVLLRSAPFGDLLIDFDDRVLAPRPWTAAQSRWAAELLRNAPAGSVLELCAGAGHIGLLAIRHEPRPMVAVDLSPVACDYARANAARAGLADLVEVREGAMEDVVAADERFAVVIADPPWVPRDETGRYPEDPVLAIDGGADGLDLARQCWVLADRHLLDGGSAVLQLGTVDQARRLARELRGRTSLRVRECRTFDRGVLVALSS